MDDNATEASIHQRTPDTPPQPLDDAPTEDTAINNTSADVVMAEDAEPAPVDVKMSPKEPTPLAEPRSDNPLDAPEGPRPEIEDAEAIEENVVADEAVEKKDDIEGDAEEAVNGEEQTTQDKANLEASARSHLATQTHAIILPSYSTWFDMSTIHPNEQKALPEFFNSRNRSKTPAVYKDYRDFMVNTYRLNPTEYLTFTACRRNLAGDVCAIMRVHAFLEQWGLLNYQVDPDSRPSNIAPPFTGHFRVIADTPRGLQPFQPAPNARLTTGKPHPSTERRISQPLPSGSDLNLSVRQNIYDQQGKDITPAADQDGANGESLDKRLAQPEKPVHCQSCANDCTRERWHRVKSAPDAVSGKTAAMNKFDVCPQCYTDGRFPEQSVASEFVKLENPQYGASGTHGTDKDRAWDDRETLLLLEGLEAFDDDWYSVAEHVGTRTREQCVLKFLQLEVEDKYIAAESTNNGNNASADSGLAYLGAGRVPFSQADNPVMSVLSFLAGGVDPAVAAAASGQAVDEMVRTMDERRKTLQQRFEEQHTKSGSTAAEARSPGATAPAPADTTPSTVVKPEQGTETDSVMDVDNAVTTQSSKKPNDPATTALALASARSFALASHTERHIASLLSTATSLQLEKLSLKLQQFSEMEALLAAERRDVERRSKELFLERLAWRRRCDVVREAVTKGVEMGLGKEDGEGLRTVTEALKGFGIKNERLELSAASATAHVDGQPMAAEAGGVVGEDSMVVDKIEDQDASAANPVSAADISGPAAPFIPDVAAQVQPISEDDPTFKKYDI